MFCSKCGKEINDNANYCLYCGENFNPTQVDLESQKAYMDKLAQFQELHVCRCALCGYQGQMGVVGTKWAPIKDFIKPFLLVGPVLIALISSLFVYFTFIKLIIVIITCTAVYLWVPKKKKILYCPSCGQTLNEL